MAIFNSYVSLPEGILSLSLRHIIISSSFCLVPKSVFCRPQILIGIFRKTAAISGQDSSLV